MSDFHPCPSCPADFTMPAALAEHQLTCRPRPAVPARKKAERTGDKFEALVKRSAKAQGLTLSKSQVPRGKLGQYRGKGDLDFYGHLDGQYFTFDAKSTRKLPFRLDLIKPHQAKKAKNRHTEGAIAGFVVELAGLADGPRYLFAPWPVFARFWQGDQWIAPSISLAELVRGSVEIRRRGLKDAYLDLAGAIWQLQELRDKVPR